MSSVLSSRSRPNTRFIAVVATLACAFALAFRDDLLGRLLGPLELVTAQTTVALLHFMNIEAVRMASQIHHPGGFAYEIYYRCTGVLPIAIFTICILAYPATWRHKGYWPHRGHPALARPQSGSPHPPVLCRHPCPGSLRHCSRCVVGGNDHSGNPGALVGLEQMGKSGVFPRSRGRSAMALKPDGGLVEYRARSDRSPSGESGNLEARRGITLSPFMKKESRSRTAR